MHQVDIVDDTFIRAAPARVRAIFDDPAELARLWPWESLTLLRDRGPKGVRWTATGLVDGELEVWLEPFSDGVVLHHYVRGHAQRGSAQWAARRHTVRWKSGIHGWKDRLEDRAL